MSFKEVSYKMRKFAEQNGEGLNAAEVFEKFVAALEEREEIKCAKSNKERLLKTFRGYLRRKRNLAER